MRLRISRIFSNDFNLLTVSTALRSFALTSMDIFVPIFLLNSGFSLKEVLLFLLVARTVHIFLVPLGAYLTSKFGPKYMIFISTLIFVTYYLNLNNVSQSPETLLPTAVILGVATSFYYLSLNIYTSTSTHKKNRGREVGILWSTSKLSSVIAPISGGLFLTFLPYEMGFVFTSGILITSCLPLFLTKDIHKEQKISLKGLLSVQALKDALSFIGFGIETEVALTLWPLILYLGLSKNLTSIGGLSSLRALFSLLGMMVAGYIADKKWKLTERLSACILSFLWFISQFLYSSPIAGIFNAVLGFVRAFVTVPNYTKTLNHSQEYDLHAYFALREIYVLSGIAILYTTLYFVTDLNIALIQSSLSSFLYLLL